jgi:hypothetical protein
MRWHDTIASKCRYGEIAERIFGNMEIIWESSYEDWQGSANILATNGINFYHYEWCYGSCSGCDDWEARSLSSEQIEDEMRAGLAVLKDLDTAKKYVQGTGMESAFLEWSKNQAN